LNQVADSLRPFRHNSHIINRTKRKSSFTPVGSLPATVGILLEKPTSLLAFNRPMFATAPPPPQRLRRIFYAYSSSAVCDVSVVDDGAPLFQYHFTHVRMDLDNSSGSIDPRGSGPYFTQYHPAPRWRNSCVDIASGGTLVFPCRHRVYTKRLFPACRKPFTLPANTSPWLHVVPTY
jgi:hypothetical protein